MFKNSIETKINIDSNTKSIWQELINFEEYKNWNPAMNEELKKRVENKNTNIKNKNSSK
ncbi:hypothetical protein [Aliarcobacter cryaerophilus]|uniref:hypothetical protein n=1 Tax=Aliarcobacter cryaerophilus TaxID=28198 RepID=UPI0013FE1412|nr:hypothetical protein [Aliarcobacter cryaerophilus]